MGILAVVSFLKSLAGGTGPGEDPVPVWFFEFSRPPSLFGDDSRRSVLGAGKPDTNPDPGSNLPRVWVRIVSSGACPGGFSLVRGDRDDWLRRR